MVATRGTDQDVVDFVTGKERIDPKTIRVEQWVKILRAAADELPINYMRGLRSLKQILYYDGSYSVERRISTPLPRLWMEDSAKYSGNEIRPNAVFLDCAQTGGGFPSGRLMSEAWEKAPRESVEEGLGRGKLLSLATGNFLLSREKKFCYLSVLWRPMEKWDDQSMSSTPQEFWYQADLNTLAIKELNDKNLDLMLAAAHERTLAQNILQSFNIALVESVSDARGQYDHMLTSKSKIEGYLDRIGQLVT